MPIYDLGYRSWQGQTVPEAFRFWAIAETGIRLAWQSRLLRRLLFFAWLPALYLGAMFFVFEQVKTGTGPIGRAASRIPSGAIHESARDRGRLLRPGSDARDIRGPLGEFASLVPGGLTPELLELDRHAWWSVFLWFFFHYSQLVITVLLVGLVAPPLISQDVRTKAFLLYFSRPLTRVEYILGKMATLWGYLLLITVVPMVALYVVGVFLSPGFSVVKDTADLPLRILAASAVLMIPTSALALALSAMTSDSRYVYFVWFAIWAVGWVTYVVLLGFVPDPAVADRWSLVSLFHTLGKVQGWIFGVRQSHETISWATIELAAITVVSLVVLFRRVSSPMRI